MDTFYSAVNAATGDNTAVMLIIAGVAVVGIVVTAILFRKHKKDGDDE
jgi:LPXTG-motif cell wall-anchored protein